MGAPRESERQVIRYVVLGVLLTHLFWALVVMGGFWYLSRDPAPKKLRVLR